MRRAPDLTDLFDQELVALALRGQDAAFSELLRRYQSRVRKMLYHMVQDEELAKELTQDTFLKVHTSLHTYRPELKFSSWLFAIANNVGIDHMRHRELDTLSIDGSPWADTPRGREATALQVAQHDPTPTPTPPPDREAQAEALRQAIKRLRGNLRRCAELRHIHGHTYDTIGEVLHLPPNTVRTYLYRAKIQLAEMLGTLPVDSRQASSGGPPTIA